MDEGKLLELLKVVGHEHLTDKDIKLIHDVSSIELSYSGAVFTVCYAINIVSCVLVLVILICVQQVLDKDEDGAIGLSDFRSTLSYIDHSHEHAKDPHTDNQHIENHSK